MPNRKKSGPAAAVSCGIDYFTRSVLLGASTVARFFTDGFVEFAIEFARRQAVWSGRDYGGFASRRQRVEDSAIGIEGAICDQQVGGHMRQQRISPGQVVRLSRGQQQAQRIAERVNQRMDLAAQTAAAAAKCLVLSFF